MIEKYEDVFERGVYPYIHNRIQANAKTEDIVKEVYDRFPVYIAFFKCNQEMIVEMLRQIVSGMRLIMNTYAKSDQ
jgi:hypothetical protein